jgi:lysylphosphatidylglycerol synthetase-like protein (DUF2156 family)
MTINLDATAGLALDAVTAYTDADNPSAFLAVNDGNSYFRVPGLSGLVVYRPAGRYLVQFGGPFAPNETYAELLHGFREFAKEEGKTVVGIQLQRLDAELYAKHGFTVNQVGASYAIDLSRFSLQGTRFMPLRNKIARAHKAGLMVREVDWAEWADAINALDKIWLGSKGEHVAELQFLVGQRGGDMQRHRRLFVGTIDGALMGYISYSPVYGTRGGWMHDLSRRVPNQLPGIMEAINSTAIARFTEEGVPWLHFGFTPFTSLAEEHEQPGYSIGFKQFMHLLWEYGEQVYPAKTQLAYKQKWEQHLVLPEYVAFDGPADIGAFAAIFRAAGALG